ncbi:hypothetical protein F5Y15DRAFT_280726 [Xylariaceae sp. FL0016]|nr:hypothetical protein F5Y15DRAFT_280726 [Xylariaceae sp. FL0016]
MYPPSVFMLVATLFSFVHGRSIARTLPNFTEIKAASAAWQCDTVKVSQFLDAATSLTGHDLVTAAEAALTAENNELVQKEVLDRAFTAVASARDAVDTADDTLVRRGTFQAVVGGLAELTKGDEDTDVVELIDRINRGRCRDVLPSIDDYLVQGSKLVGGQNVVLFAERPRNYQKLSY